MEELRKKSQLALESSAKKSQQIQDLLSEKSELKEFLTARLLHEHFHQYFSFIQFSCF